MVYRLLYRLVLSRIDAERAHHLGFGLIRVAAALPPLRWALTWLLAPSDPILRVSALGLEFPGPFGLAAGFDKNALSPDGLAMLGFGFVEVGTVTAQAQPGNPRPRLFRLLDDRALINRMGFNNDGAATVGRRLQRSKPVAVLGINIGKTKVTQPEDAVADYVTSTTLLGALAGYFVVNVSSPNTPGLRDLQAVDQLRPLLAAVRSALDDVTGSGRRVPLLVKIAPDLADEDVDAVAELALELGLDGIIATNTTIGRSGLRTPDPAQFGAGGLSGPVLKDRSLAVLRRLKDRVGDRLVLIAAGGITTADDAWERLEAGATLLQGYTGFIYNGPFWAASIHRGLARRARAAGLESIGDLK